MTNTTGPDEWDGPDHPRAFDRFAGRPLDYPGGLSAYLYAFEGALREYYRITFPVWKTVIPVDSQMTEDDWSAMELRSQVRRKVQEVTLGVAARAGVTHRDLSYWLVKEHGFPWRDDCELPELEALYTFVTEPTTVELARHAPHYPTPQERMAAAERPRAEDLL